MRNYEIGGMSEVIRGKEDERLKGSDIKKFLYKKGIKQNFVAAKTGIPAPTLNQMLNDKRKIEVNEYIQICDAIGVPLEQFRKESR